MDYHHNKSKSLRTDAIPLGAVTLTSGAQQALTKADVLSALYRHSHGDWGDVDEEDWMFNDMSLCAGRGMHSVFYATNGVKFLVDTDFGRSLTTLLLAEEFCTWVGNDRQVW